MQTVGKAAYERKNNRSSEQSDEQYGAQTVVKVDERKNEQSAAIRCYTLVIS